MCSTGESAIEIEELDEERAKLTEKIHHNMEFVLVGPKKVCLPSTYRVEGPIFQNFRPRKDDVWMFGFPRSGTTMMQEIIWLIGNDLNYEKASQTVMDLRFSFFDNSLFDYMGQMEDFLKNDDEKSKLVRDLLTPAWKRLEQTEERRFIKTHLPLSLMPKVLTSGCKIVYVCRNPGDVFVSCCFFISQMEHTEPNFPNYWDLFRNNLSLWTPYFEHVKEGWAIRNRPNVLFVVYDEFTKDMRKNLMKVADFLDKQLSNGDLDRLEEHLKIDNFRKNKSVNNEHLKEFHVMANVENGFIRKGKRGGWRDYVSGTLEEDINRWIEENLGDCGLYEYFK